MALERNMTILRRMNEILDLNTLTLMIIINNKESPSSTGCSSKPSLFEVENHVSAVSAGAAIWIVAYERRFVLGLLIGWAQRPKPLIFVPNSDESLLLKIVFANV